MKCFVLAIALVTLSASASSQTSSSLDDISISIDCALAIRTTVEDLERRMSADWVNEFRGFVCSDTHEERIMVWVQPCEDLSNGGGYLYEINRDTQQILARNPQR